MTQRVAALVIGGGISGLVCTYALRKAGVDALCIEAQDEAGGVIQTLRRDGYVFELGPQSFTGTPEMAQLFHEIGIRDQIVHAPVGSPRYVLIDGALQRVPMSPPAFLSSGFVGVGTKFSLFRDLIGSSNPPEKDESVAEFVRRKFSPELLERLVGPFVSGVYAGDPEKLSLRSAFPSLYNAEKRKGSVIRGMISKSKERKPGEPRQRPTLLSFRDGTRTFPHALAAKLGERLVLNANAIEIAVVPSTDGSRYNVTIRMDDDDNPRSIVADHIIIATATQGAAKLTRGLVPEIADRLTEIDYAPVAVVSLGYRKEDIDDPLHGFGFLVPRSAGIRTLGTVWNTSLFPGRAPEGHVLLTSFLGGATDRKVMEVSFQDQLAPLVHRELAPLLKIRTGAPAFSSVWMYARAIPQYNIGHGERLAAVDEAREKHPGLWLIGNYLRGPAIGACVEQALSVADEIIRRQKR